MKSCVMGRRMFSSRLSHLILLHLITLAAREAAAHILSVFPDLPLNIDAYMAEYDAGLDRLWPTVQPLPGAYRLVRHLHAHGVPMALATGSRRKNYISKTRHLADLFACFGDRVVCGDDLRGDMSGKPAPDIFLMAAREKLGLDVGVAREACTGEEKKSPEYTWLSHIGSYTAKAKKTK